MAKNKMLEHAKLIKINIIVLLVGGISYSVIYFLGGEIVLGLAIILVSAVMSGSALLLQKKSSEKTTIYFLTFVQYAAIVAFGLLGGEFAGGFTLITAVVAFNCIYFEKLPILMQWILTDIVLLVSLFFMDELYGAVSISLLIRSVMGINFCMLFLYMLLTWVLKFKSDSAEKEATSQNLVKQIEVKMKEQQESTIRTQNVFRGIKESSNNLRHTSEQMLEVAKDLSANASNQTEIIHVLAEKSQEMAEEIKSTKQIALDSSELVSNNAKVLAISNENMTQAVDTIGEMEASSRKIIDIIKQIEDIASQTNILALNAAIEAARAGANGKGFAVVAEEVQSLAAKSAEAASASSLLVNENITKVQAGSSFIKEAAQSMENVIEESNMTAKKVADINDIIEEQVKTVEEIMEQMNGFKDVITQTSHTAEQSNDMANDIAEQIAHINTAMSAG